MALLACKVSLELLTWRFSPSQGAQCSFWVEQETRSRLDSSSRSLPAQDSSEEAEEHVPAAVTLLCPAETVTGTVALGCALLRLTLSIYSITVFHGLTGVRDLSWCSPALCRAVIKCA